MTPAEIAKAVVFLASDDSSYIPRAELFVVGGLAQVEAVTGGGARRQQLLLSLKINKHRFKPVETAADPPAEHPARSSRKSREFANIAIPVRRESEGFQYVTIGVGIALPACGPGPTWFQGRANDAED